MPKLTPSDPRRRWHRLFGLLLTDHLRGSPFTVELEKDLSQRQQLLDVVIVRRGPGAMSRAMPDGLQDLANHNLISFKSFREPFDDWTLKELTGHYVNYRKQVSRSGQELLPEAEFRLFGICARHPRQLLEVIAHEQVQDGVYNLRRGTDAIRLLVAAELPRKEENALLHLFSAAQEQVEYGAEHYHLQYADTSSIVNQLFGEYRREGLTMPYTMEDFRREVALGYWELTPKERREHLLRLTPAEKREYFLRLTPEERREYFLRLTPAEKRECFQRLTPAERLAGLSEDQIRAYLAGLHKAESRKPRKTKRRSR